MKKTSKLILGVVAVVLLVLGVQQGLKYYLQGSPRPFNALLISGNIEDVNKAKDIYKEDTKETKEYKYKTVLNIEKMLDENGNVIIEKPLDKNGKEIEGAEGIEAVHENKFLVMTKSTAKEMLKDQIFRVRKNEDPTSGSLETVVLENIKGVDTDTSIYLGYPEKNKKMEVNSKSIPLQNDSYSWIGYYPSSEGTIVITDDNTYKSIDNKEKVMSLIKFKKGNKDLRNAEDKAEPTERLANIPNIEINYADIKK